MQPEIFRRCSACGASFRSGALFCPQCGLGTSSAQAKEEAPGAKAAVGKKDFASTNINAAMPTMVDFESNEADETLADSFMNEEPSAEGDVSEVARAQDNVNLDQTLPISTSPSQLQRTPEAPQLLHPPVVPTPPLERRKQTGVGPSEAERRFRPGMQKLRKGTSIVIDEASYDPSLRFVLIAGILFLLFIVLLILSKWIG